MRWRRSSSSRSSATAGSFRPTRRSFPVFASWATLRSLTRDLHDRIAKRTADLVHGLRAIAASRDVPFTADSAGSMFGFFFRREPVRSFAEAKDADTKLFARFFHAALDRGVYLAP